MMANERPTGSRLFTTSVIEGRLDLDEKFDKAFSAVLGLTRNLSDKEVHDALHKAIEDRKNHDDICVGLLVGILSDPPKASKYYRDLALISQDSFKTVTDMINHIVTERYSRLLDTARKQLLWVVQEMIRNYIPNVEGLVWGLLRQIAGGDLSMKNVWLADTLVDILREHRPWLDSFPVIVASVAYTYLRILEDHHGPQYAALRQKEVHFVVGLLKERFPDCLKIGRDLVRLLQNVARIPEIDAFWVELMNNPTSLAPNFKGIVQLLQTRTSRRYFVVRLTPEMEKKIVFLCTDVRFGSQKRYQEWFQRQYLNTPESQTLRCDLIRFIIGCIHPTNEVLCSDIIPRWAVIGWLTSSSASPVVTANAKLSLFYDWFFFNSELDNIMNIEPGILVMYHSLRPYPMLTTSLLDFLCRVIPNFCPKYIDLVRTGVKNSLRSILEKRVVACLEPLFGNPRMDADLRKLVRDTFPDFCASSVSVGPPPEEFVSPIPVIKQDLMVAAGLDFSPPTMNNDDLGNHMADEDDAVFSDEDDDVKPHLPVVKAQKRTEDNLVFPTKRDFISDSVKTEVNSLDLLNLETTASKEMIEFNKHIEQLEDDMKAFLQDYRCEKTTKGKCDILQKICDLIFSEDLTDGEARDLAAALSHLLASEIENEESLLPVELSPEALEDVLNKPVYIIFDNLVTLAEDDHRQNTLYMLMVELHKASPPIGYHLLFFLKANSIRMERENQESRLPFLQTYKNLCKAAGQKDFTAFLLKDLQMCAENDPRLTSWIIPEIYQTFPKQTLGNVDILQTVIQRLDSCQVHDLVCMILQGSLQMFENNHFANILDKSLEWETVEQMFLWQLARAHEVPVDCCLSVLPKLKFRSHTGNVLETHGEALSNILMMLRRESPSEGLLRHLLLREVRDSDPTVVTILEYWVKRYEDKMAKLLHDIISLKQQPSPSKRKRNQNSKAASNVSLDQVLSHLNHLRLACDQIKFFNLETMQEALQNAQNNCSEAQKKKYSDLLALIPDDVVEVEPVRKPKVGRGRKPKTRKKQESETEEESSEDEEVKKPTRKKRKNNHVQSDSD